MVFGAPYLKLMRTYVTWSMPPSWTYRSSSSVADMNNSPDATKSYTMQSIIARCRHSTGEPKEAHTHEWWHMSERALLVCSSGRGFSASCALRKRVI